MVRVTIFFFILDLTPLFHGANLSLTAEGISSSGEAERNSLVRGYISYVTSPRTLRALSVDPNSNGTHAASVEFWRQTGEKPRLVTVP